MKHSCSCSISKHGTQQSNNYYSENINHQTQYLPTGNDTYWIPNRLNQSTTFSYSSDDILLNNHNEPEFINYEQNTNPDIYKLSPLSGEAFQPDEIFQLDQPIRYPNNACIETSPQTLLDLGSGTIEMKINPTSHCFNDGTDSFYNLNEDSTSSSQNNDTNICAYSSYHLGNNNNNVTGSSSSVAVGHSSEISGLNNCDGIGHMAPMPRFENSFQIQYENQSVNFKAHRANYDEMVVDNGYRKAYEGLYDEHQTFMNQSGSEHAMMNDKTNLQSNLSSNYQQQFMEPCFNYASNDVIDSNVSYKIALDSGQ